MKSQCWVEMQSLCDFDSVKFRPLLKMLNFGFTDGILKRRTIIKIVLIYQTQKTDSIFVFAKHLLKLLEVYTTGLVPVII